MDDAPIMGVLKVIVMDKRVVAMSIEFYPGRLVLTRASQMHPNRLE